MDYMKCLILCFSLFLAFSHVYAADTLHMEKGEFSVLRLPLPAGRPLECTIQCSNPTVIYPDSVYCAGRRQELTILSDSVWQIRITDTGAIQLYVQALSGNDSLCTLFHQNIRAGTENATDTVMIIAVHSLIPLPYIRIATLAENIPNPIERGKQTTWAYRVDKATPVHILLYDIRGKIIEEFRSQADLPGNYTFSYTPGQQNTAPGVYLIRMLTNSGEQRRLWCISP
jgi:hypothetical protein